MRSLLNSKLSQRDLPTPKKARWTKTSRRQLYWRILTRQTRTVWVETQYKMILHFTKQSKKARLSLVLGLRHYLMSSPLKSPATQGLGSNLRPLKWRKAGQTQSRKRLDRMIQLSIKASLTPPGKTTTYYRRGELQNTNEPKQLRRRKQGKQAVSNLTSFYKCVRQL